MFINLDAHFLFLPFVIDIYRSSQFCFLLGLIGVLLEKQFKNSFMKRQELIKSKLAEKEVVDFEEIQSDDKHSLTRLKDNAEDELRTVEKSIKKYLSNHTLTLGEEFVTLVEKQNSISARVKTLEEIIEQYV